MLGHRSLNTEDYLDILKRRWWILCIPAAILPIITVAATFFITPQYQSTSEILIKQQEVPTDVVKPLDMGDLQSRLALITTQIESHTTLETIVTKYNLYASQHLSMDTRVDLVRTKGLSVAPLQSQIGSTGLPGFKVQFTADDPHTAQQVCGEITGLYTQKNAVQREDVTKGTSDFLQTVIDEKKHELDDMDAKLAAFQQKNMGMLPEDVSNTNNVLSSLGSRLDATTSQLQQLELSLSTATTLLAQQAQQSAPGVVTAEVAQADQKELTTLENQLTDLKARYSEDYPDVKSTERQIADLRSQMAKEAAATPAPAAAAPTHFDSPDTVRLRTQIKILQQEIDDKHKEQAELTGEMRSSQARLQASPEVQEQYKELQRDYNTKQADYQKLVGQLDQSSLAREMETREQGENFELLDTASLPVDPIFPNRGVFAAGGLAGGLGLGVLIIAFLEYRDTAIRNERDVWAFTQLPTLAVIAWSSDVAETSAVKSGLRRLLRRKDKELLAG